MFEKIKQINIKFLIILFFSLTCVFVVLFFLNNQKEDKIIPIIQNEEKIIVGNGTLPIRIKIPDISVDTTVEHVGTLPDGSMDVPSLPSTTAWYNLGTIPGEIGSAVIDGHAGYRNGVPAVFDYLYKLHIGDKIYIESDTGEMDTFVVRKKESYKEDADSDKIFHSNDGLAHLNLITCSGIWDKKSKSHPERLVIFADLEK